MLATFLATSLILVFVTVNLIRQKNRGKLFEPAYSNRGVCAVVLFIGGVTLGNGLFHFLHGILGYSDFPAPFSMFVKNNVFTNSANVVWGLFNFGITAFLGFSYRSAVQKGVYYSALMLGFLFIALMLRFVLLASYFQAHSF